MSRKRKSGRARTRAARRAKCGHVCTCGCERRCVKGDGHESDPETAQHRYMTPRGPRACPNTGPWLTHNADGTSEWVGAAKLGAAIDHAEAQTGQSGNSAAQTCSPNPADEDPADGG